MDLPTSSVAWTLHLPARFLLSRPYGDIEPQVFWGQGDWHQPTSHQGFIGGLAGDIDVDGDAGGAAGGETGAMPVRIEIPRSGKRREYTRYWLEAEQPAEVTVYYARTALLLPLLMLGVLLAAAGLWALGEQRWGRRRVAGAWAAGAVGAAALGLFAIDRTWWLFVSVLLAAVALSLSAGLV
jgi:hypothetical protein